MKNFNSSKAAHQGLRALFLASGVAWSFVPSGSFAYTCAQGAFGLSDAQLRAADLFKSQPKLRPLAISQTVMNGHGQEWKTDQNGETSLSLHVLPRGREVRLIFTGPSLLKNTSAQSVLEFAKAYADSLKPAEAPATENTRQAASEPTESQIVAMLDQVRRLALRALVGTPEGMHAQLGSQPLAIEFRRPTPTEPSGPIFLSDRIGLTAGMGIVVTPDFFSSSQIVPKERDLALRHAVYSLRILQSYSVMPHPYWSFAINEFVAASLNPDAPTPGLAWLPALQELPDYRKLAQFNSLKEFERRGIINRFPELGKYLSPSFQLMRRMEASSLLTHPAYGVTNYQAATQELVRLVMLSIESQQGDIAAVGDRNHRRGLFDAKFGRHYGWLIDRIQQRMLN